MHTKPFREHHLLQLLADYEEQHLPLDLFISHYFRAHRALGSKDRAMIAEALYGMIRWRGLLDHLCEGTPGWENRYSTYINFDPAAYLDREAIPMHIRLSFPGVLYQLIEDCYGEAQARELCLACNMPAPTTVRINPLKATREAMLQRWAPHYQVSPCEKSPLGIIFHKKIAFFGLPEFKEGFFEIQDEGSQLLADLVQVEPGQHVMDYCAGSGGKALAFAHKMEGSGQIYLHDIRPRILVECKKRLRRSGIQNGQIVGHDDPKLKKLKKRMDWVLVDAPCTGTGTLRRNPDMKWKFTEKTLPRLVGQQRMIFERALSYVKPGGHIVYGTCSLLPAENQQQIEHFLATYPLEVVGPFFQSLPEPGKMDGFFGAVLRLREKGVDNTKINSQ